MSVRERETIPWPAIEIKWIAHADTGSRFGATLLARLPPGAGYEVHRHRDVERVIYVLEGRGVHRGSNRPIVIDADDVLVLPPGSWHGFENESDCPAVLLILYAPATSFPFEDYERAGPNAPVDAEPIRRKLHDGPERPEISTPEHGFDNFSVKWGGAEGARSIVLGNARFATGGRHRWHRHTKADEAFYVLSGRGHHWTDESGDVVLKGGEHCWVPCNQWHKWTMDYGDEADVVWWYLGARTLDESGYELRESTAEMTGASSEEG